MNESELADRLRRIQAVFEGAATEGERAAAAAAEGRVAARLEALRQEAEVEYRFSLNNPWSRRLLMAVLRRHGLEPFRRHGQRRTTIMARMTRRYFDRVIGPEFTRLDETLQQYLEDVASRVTAQVIHANQAEPEVVECPSLPDVVSQSG